MQQHTLRLALASLALAATALGARPAAADDAFRHGHIRQVEPGVTLQRATETSAEEAIRNLPFLPGDRVWTDATGRTEFQFPEGTSVRVDSRSKLDYADHDDSQPGRVVLRIWSGSMILRTRAQESALFDIETPGGLVQVVVPSVVRIDVDGGETRLSVYEGEASLDTGQDRVVAGPGEQTRASWGGAPAEPAPFDRYAGDEFARWDADLESQEAWAANSSRYLPEELEPYAPEFDTHGSWVYEQPVGYVWQPRVVSGWAPYTNGRWSWTSFGWTWVPYEPWGWAPHHYGRWGFSVSLGWYWAPGRVWSAGWVSWGIGGGYVGWCALGPRNRPVVPWPHHRGRHHRGYATPRSSIGPGGNRGHAVPRGSVGHDRAWSVVRSGDLGQGDIAARRVDPAGVGGLRVADSVGQRPDRGVNALTRSAAIPGAARARPRAGASSRAARGASPVPMGSTSRSLSSRPGAAGRTRAAGGSGAAAATSGIAGAAVRARARSSNPAATGPSSGARGGVATASPGSRSGAARARPRSGTVGATAAPSTSRGSTPWIGSSRSRGATATRPRSSTGRRDQNPIGSLFDSERSRSAGRARPRSTGTSSRPSSSGVSSRPRSGSSRPSGVSSRSRSGSSRPSGVSSRSRSGSSRPSGVSSRSRSGSSRSSGVSSRSRSSSSRSSGVSSRPRSGSSRPSGVSSRSRSGSSRSSGVSSRSRSSSGSRRGGAVGSTSRRRPH